MENKISFSIDSTKMTAILEALSTIDANLTGLITLTDEERQSMPRFGDKSTSFVDKALVFGKERTDVIPSYLSLIEMEKDVEARPELLKIITPMRSILEKLEDSYLLAGTEAFLAALVIYDILKKADHDGVPGLRNMIDDLQKRFPGKRRPLK